MAMATDVGLSLADLTPAQIRQVIRDGQWRRPTSGLASGYTQANLVIVSRELAYDFLVFCQRNPQPCPLLEVLDPGDAEPRDFAPGADIRLDVPRYRVYRYGVLDDEVDDLRAYGCQDHVGFLLGCSFTFEHPLMDAGMAVRHIELGENVPMFITNRPCKLAGVLHGPMVVSMRPLPGAKVMRAVQIASRFLAVHRAPIHVGDSCHTWYSRCATA